MIRTTLTVLAGGALVAAGLSAAHAQTQRLRMANWLPPKHHVTVALQNWTKLVEKESGGTLKIRILKSPLAKPPGQYDLVKNNIADIAWGVAGYTPGIFPLLRAWELPFVSPNSEKGSVAAWNWYSRNGLLKREWKDAHLVLLWVHGPGHLHTKTKVMKIEDLKGMKLRVGGGGVAMADKLGGVPVAMSATKAHESLLRGTTSGTLFPWEAIKGFRLVKLVKYHLEFPGGLYATPFWMAMSKKAWNGLSAKHKAVITKLGGEWGSRYMGQNWDKADAAGRALAKKNGNIFNTIDANEYKRWKARVQFMDKEWVERANKKGLDGTKLLMELRKSVSN